MSEDEPSTSQTAVDNPEENPVKSLVSTQVEDTVHRSNEWKKIYAMLENLETFSGRADEFRFWRTSVDKIVEMGNTIRNTPDYNTMMLVIRNKIRGAADKIVDIESPTLDWDKIKKSLMFHYLDKRDITTLDYQMMKLVQGRSSIERYYDEICELLSLIIEKIDCHNYSTETKMQLMNWYKDKALQIFIRGLKGDIPMLLTVGKPSTLAEALRVSLELENISPEKCKDEPSTSQAAADNTEENPVKSLDSTEVEEEEECKKIGAMLGNLETFSGHADEFRFWRKSVDKIVEMGNTIRNTPDYNTMMLVIRNKIRGDADTFLKKEPPTLDWGKIKRRLMFHYLDKRDINTLDYQLVTLAQGHLSVEQYFDEVNELLWLIIEEISRLDYSTETKDELRDWYHDQALHVFIRGLNGDLAMLLTDAKPSTLPDAFEVCLELDKMSPGKYKMLIDKTDNGRLPNHIPYYSMCYEDSD